MVILLTFIGGATGCHCGCVWKQAHSIKLLLDLVHVIHELVEAQVDGGAGAGCFIRVLDIRRCSRISQERRDRKSPVLLDEELYCFQLASVEISQTNILRIERLNFLLTIFNDLISLSQVALNLVDIVVFCEDLFHQFGWVLLHERVFFF